MKPTPPITAPPVRLKRFTPEVTALLARIQAALSRIESANIWPSSTEALRFSAQVGTIHYSTLLEGNRLGILEAQRAVRRSLDAQTQAEIELVNYVDGLRMIDERGESDQLEFSEQLILESHRELTKGLGDPDGHFKPHHEGAWRDGEAMVVDPFSNMAVHSGCPQDEVRPRMLGLIDWVAKVEDDQMNWPIHVVAGIVHHNLTDIHPFADGNGRAARLLTSALLLRHGKIPGRMFNFERYYGLDRSAYLSALRSFQGGNGSHEVWMQYFLEGAAEEYERVAGEVDRLSYIGSTRGGEKVQLSKTQERGLIGLALVGTEEFSRRDYEREAGIGRAAANRDLGSLAGSGVLDRMGSGPSSRYRFSASALKNPWSKHPTKWTEQKIKTELRDLVGSGTTFPTIREFRENDRMNLYSAINRNGGSRVWANKLGIQLARQGPKSSD